MQFAARFRDRLFLPNNCAFQLKEVHFNLLPIPEWVKHNSVELYHATRSDPKNAFHSICKNGFQIGLGNNKGFGVYVADHGRYSLFWGSTTEENYHHVMAFRCKVSALHQFRSEIESGSREFNSEFVIRDPLDIWASHFISYTIDNPEAIRFPVFVNIDCLKCVRTRCDCELACKLIPESRL
jgi:hypothetical protein